MVLSQKWLRNLATAAPSRPPFSKAAPRSYFQDRSCTKAFCVPERVAKLEQKCPDSGSFVQDPLFSYW
jgi:hypothetical protein